MCLGGLPTDCSDLIDVVRFWFVYKGICSYRSTLCQEKMEIKLGLARNETKRIFGGGVLGNLKRRFY